MSARKFCTWRASHQCGLYNASAGLICWRELVDRGHIRWDCSVWGCPCSRSWLLILPPPWTCPPLWGSPKSYQCFLDEGEEHYICLGPVSLPLLGDGLLISLLLTTRRRGRANLCLKLSQKNVAEHLSCLEGSRLPVLKFCASSWKINMLSLLSSLIVCSCSDETAVFFIKSIVNIMGDFWYFH